MSIKYVMSLVYNNIFFISPCYFFSIFNADTLHWPVVNKTLINQKEVMDIILKYVHVFRAQKISGRVFNTDNRFFLHI